MKTEKKRKQQKEDKLERRVTAIETQFESHRNIGKKKKQKEKERKSGVRIQNIDEKMSKTENTPIGKTKPTRYPPSVSKQKKKPKIADKEDESKKINRTFEKEL